MQPRVKNYVIVFMDNAYTFLLSLLGGVAFFRVILYAISKPLTEVTIHTREGFKFHHLHFGVIVVFFGVTLMLMNFMPLAYALAGFGLGAILDEFIPSLYLKEPEPYTSRLYRSSQEKTLALVALLCLTTLFVLALQRS